MLCLAAFVSAFVSVCLCLVPRSPAVGCVFGSAFGCFLALLGPAFGSVRLC